MTEPRGNNASDDEADESLFSEFEAACTSVTQLYRNHCWRNFQNAAAQTTQLYKGGVDAKKRSFEKGYQNGRLQLAKEILALKRYQNKIDIQDLYSVLSKYALVPNEHHLNINPRPRSMNSPTESSQAVNLFQQALNTSNSPGSQRAPDLNNFLQHQVYRHRKRQHSPMDTRFESSSGSPNSYSPNHLFKRRRP